MEKASASIARKCPKCGSEGVSRSRRRGMAEKAISLLGFMPYRCSNYYCRQRFFLFTVPKVQAEKTSGE